MAKSPPILLKFWAVWRPFFTVNQARLKAWGWLGLMLILLVLESGVLVAFSYTQRDFSTAMSEKDQEGFYRGVWRYVALLLAAAPLFAFSKFVQGKLGLDWRRWLTKHLCGLYFSNRAFYLLKIGSLAPDRRIPAESRDRSRGEEQGGDIDNPVSAVDNPDQRIGEDISTFTTNCISVLVVFVGSVLKVCSFVGVLLSISPRLTSFVLVYSIAGTLSTTFMFGARLKHLIFESAKREANFRFGLVRVREHAEEIAFYRGERGEKEVVMGLLDRVVSNVHLKLWCDAQLAVFSNSFMWLTAVLPYLVVAERYFSGEIEFGVISQTAMAFRVIQNALSVIVTQIRTLASLASEVDRLHYLLACMESANVGGENAHSHSHGLAASSAVLTGEEGYVKVASDKPNDNRCGDGGGSDDSHDVLSVDDEGQFVLPPPVAGKEETCRSGDVSENGGSIRTVTLTGDIGPGGTVMAIDDVTLFTPDGKGIICKDLSICASRGQSVLVFGPSGCGKSSLLRAISGLWTAGRGRIRRPADERTMFIPQKPYLPLGSLRAQMEYPKSASESVANGAWLQSILERVQLGYLCARSGGLETTRDWQDELSLGEQQRLAFSRLLTNTPSMLFLDEATSALDETNEARLYAWVQAAPVDAFVSVGHRASLFKFHTHVLRGQGDGQWFFHTMEEFLSEHYTPALLGD